MMLWHLRRAGCGGSFLTGEFALNISRLVATDCTAFRESTRLCCWHFKPLSHLKILCVLSVLIADKFNYIPRTFSNIPTSRTCCLSCLLKMAQKLLCLLFQL